MQTFEIYLRTEAGLSELTIQAYLYDIKQYLDSVDGDPFSSCLLDEFISKIQNSHKPNTVKRKQMSVRSFYHYLISNDLIDENVLAGITSLKSEESEIRILNQQEIKKLLDSLSGPNKIRDRAMILLMYQSGLRASEVCTLRVVDVLWGSASIRVTGKGRVDRMIPMCQECQDALAPCVKESSGERVFSVSRHAVTDMIRRTGNRAGIKHATPHGLRHTCATSLMNSGMPIEMIQSILGHSDLSTTQKYLKTSSQRLKEVHGICHPRL